MDDSCHMRCYHGTSLSTAARVFDEGFHAGPSTDHTGVFLIAADDKDAAHGFNGTCFDLACARAKCTLCPKWQRFEAPSLWLMPVVLMFQHPRQEIVKLSRFSNSRASKCVIPRAPGIYLPKVSSTLPLVCCLMLGNTMRGCIYTTSQLSSKMPGASLDEFWWIAILMIW